MAGRTSPERIERLILANTSAHLGPASYFNEQIRVVLASNALTSDTADMFMRNWFPQPMLQGANEIVAKFYVMVLGTTPEGLAGCYAAVRDADLRRTLCVITAPTLVIGGIHDKVTLARHSEEIAAAIPGAKLLLLPGVHLLNVDRPEEFISAVMQFLD